MNGNKSRYVVSLSAMDINPVLVLCGYHVHNTWINSSPRAQLARAQAVAECSDTNEAPRDEPEGVTNGVNANGAATDGGQCERGAENRSQHEVGGGHGQVCLPLGR